MAYTIRGYQPGDEERQAELDHEITRTWTWPVLYTIEELKAQYAAPGFEPESVQFAFEDGEMVGFTRRWWQEAAVDGSVISFVVFPKTLPGHEDACDRLLDRLVEWEMSQGTRTIRIWGCSMWPGSFEWLESRGFSESPDMPRGYKIYMTYDPSQGPLGVPSDWVHEVQTESDLDAAAELARIWYRRPAAWCRSRLQEMTALDRFVGHLIVKQGDVPTAACILARNPVRPGVVAAYSIAALNHRALRQLLSRAVDVCAEHDADTFLVDLIFAHRHYEPTYLDLGFTQAVEYAMYEKRID